MLLDRFHRGSTIELPLKEPNGKVSPSGSIRNPIPTVGRLETMVKPIPASRSRRTAALAASVSDLASGHQRAVDIGDNELDAGHAAGPASIGGMMSSTMASTVASIDTLIGFSSAAGGSSVLNWLASSPGGMK